MKRGALWRIAAVWAAGAALTWCAIGCRTPRGEAGKKPLLCYVGGTMRPAMEAIAKLYEKQTGQPVDIDYAGSGELLIKIQQTRRGDIYVCHDPFLGLLMKRGLGRRGWVVAYVTPMIAVQKGNPKGIHGLKDLARDDVRVGLTDPTYSTVGWICKVMFKKAGISDKMAKKDIPRTRGGGQMANNVKLGHIDAAIVWDAVIHLRRDALDAVPIEPQYRPTPDVDAITTATFGKVDMSAIRVTLATLACSKQPEAARRFAEFAVSPAAQKIWIEQGFTVPPEKVGPVKTGAASEKAGGRLLLHCGAGLRPAVSKIIDAFTRKTGVVVQANYAGSGQLIASIRGSREGDVYMPGDISYIRQAEKYGLVEPPHTACYFVPVILVQKGNPKHIASVADLARPGLKIALGNPKTCAIGRKAMKIFEQNKIDIKAIQQNLVFSSATVNELGIQIKTGHADATIVWDAIAAYFKDCSDAISIPPKQNVISTVALSVLKCARNRSAARQFVLFVSGPEGKAVFRTNHYTVEKP